jgi:hypothetical protein
MARTGVLARKNLVVDARDIRSLRRVLGVATESEVVCVAVRDRLALEEACSPDNAAKLTEPLSDAVRPPQHPGGCRGRVRV